MLWKRAFYFLLNVVLTGGGQCSGSFSSELKKRNSSLCLLCPQIKSRAATNLWQRHSKAAALQTSIMTSSLNRKESVMWHSSRAYEITHYWACFWKLLLFLFWYKSSLVHSVAINFHISSVLHLNLNTFKCTATLPLKKLSMTKFLFPIVYRIDPQETGIIRAMETGNASPSLSFSASLLYSPLSLSISLLLHLRCAFICIDYQVQGRKTHAYNCSCDAYRCGTHTWVYWKWGLCLIFVLPGIIKLIDTEHLVRINC